MDLSALLSLIGPLSIVIVLLVMGLLSRQLGEQTKAKPYFVSFFVAAALMGLSTAAQLLDVLFHFPHDDALVLWILLDNGLPALAITIGVISAWRYWSWLLAERD